MPNDAEPTKEEEKKPLCFMIMPISTPDDYEPDHFDKIKNQLFIPAIRDAGYEPDRVDDNKGSSVIPLNIFEKLINAPMAICDLSSRNPNVLYELGIRHAFDMPVVLVKDIETPRIFDINIINTIDYRKSRLYDEIIEDRKKITEAIKETKAKFKTAYSLLHILKMQEKLDADKASLPENDIKGSEVNEFRLNQIQNSINTLTNLVTRNANTSKLTFYSVKFKKIEFENILPYLNYLIKNLDEFKKMDTDDLKEIRLKIINYLGYLKDSSLEKEYSKAAIYKYTERLGYYLGIIELINQKNQE